jgi:short-chain fatty acids transporter
VISVATALYLARPRIPETLVEVQTDEAKTLEISDEITSPADKMDASRFPTLFIGVALVLYIVLHFAQGGETTIDIVNWLIMALILLLSRNSREVLALTKNSASNVGDVAFQYPLYAGILGIMASTGLMEWLIDAFVSISNENTFGVLAFLSAGIVNVFVPSAGAQFSVQGPILLEAAATLGVDPGIAVMAVAYGDQWTNMIQPFWALPILAIAGLKIRDILGYTILTLFVSGRQRPLSRHQSQSQRSLQPFIGSERLTSFHKAGNPPTRRHNAFKLNNIQFHKT